ncbi:hypothetical protein [uncultured Friedmanniella sp.]|uniref:arsenate reductase/protein-tyrosine-phosphatase family protein n=1 Tax=uncultured Friedmanniella sp. TaxID=335381 RepID=UPI0035CA0B96
MTQLMVLCVCTGNVCRSPVLERLIGARLGSGADVRSAGTGALVGQPISPPMDTFLAEAGADPGGFVARQLEERLVRPAELVLTLTAYHRATVAELWPASVRHTFTVREFARALARVSPELLPAAPLVERLRVAIPLAAASRRPPRCPDSDDVPDPYRRGPAAYATAFAAIDDAVTRIVGAVAAPASPAA